jgi:hypothetical protein
MERHVSLTANFVERLGNFFCRMMHHQITRPVQGKYVCLECMRRHVVNF